MTISIDQFKSQLDPQWGYNISTPNGELLFTGVKPGGAHQPLSEGTLNGILEDHPDVELLNITRHIKNGVREDSKGNTLQKWRQKDLIEVTMEADDEDEEDDQSEPHYEPATKVTRPAEPPASLGMSGMSGVFASPATSQFLYTRLEGEKKDLEAKAAKMEAQIENLNGQIRAFELKDLKHEQEVQRLKDQIEEKGKEVTNAKSWSEKVSTVMNLAKENPEGASQLMNGVAETLRSQFGGRGSQPGLTGPMSKQLSEVIQWFQSPENTDQAKAAMQQVMIAVVQSSQGDPDKFIENASMIRDMLTPNQQQAI